MTQAYEDYSQLRVLRQPLAGVYVSFFVMVTLFILVGSTWLGLYLAKRITRPVQALSEAAREIGAGHYDHRIQHEAADEFGAMVDAFNTMAAEVASSRQRLERASSRSRAQAPGRGEPSPLHRGRGRADCDRRRVDRPHRPHRHHQRRRDRGCWNSTRR